MPARLEKRTRTNMTSKGQVLIPKDVRDLIGLKPGSPVDVGVNDRGEAVVVPSGAAFAETAEERQGVDPNPAVTEGSPDLPPGDQGG